MAQQAGLAMSIEGSSVAFEAFVSRRIDSAYRLAALVLLDRVEAEDATHDAFLKAAHSWSTLRDPLQADAWFDRIVVNECRDRLRRRRSHRVVDISDEFVETEATRDGLADAVERDRMRRALVRLSPDLRLVVVLRYHLDLAVDETALRLGIPPGTVKSRLHAALRELRAVLTADDREPTR